MQYPTHTSHTQTRACIHTHKAAAAAAAARKLPVTRLNLLFNTWMESQACTAGLDQVARAVIKVFLTHGKKHSNWPTATASHTCAPKHRFQQMKLLIEMHTVYILRGQCYGYRTVLSWGTAGHMLCPLSPYVRGSIDLNRQLWSWAVLYFRSALVPRKRLPSIIV